MYSCMYSHNDDDDHDDTYIVCWWYACVKWTDDDDHDTYILLSLPMMMITMIHISYADDTHMLNVMMIHGHHTWRYTSFSDT